MYVRYARRNRWTNLDGPGFVLEPTLDSVDPMTFIGKLNIL